MFSLRRVRSGVRRRSPTLLCRQIGGYRLYKHVHEEEAEELCGPGGGWVSSLWGLCLSYCWFIFLMLKMAAYMPYGAFQLG